MHAHPFTPAAIRKAQALGIARRKYPGGVVPLSIEAKAERRKLDAGPLALLDLATDLAHWSEVDRLQLTGLVTVPTTGDLAGRAKLAPRTLRKHLAVIEAAGLVRWIVRPSRTRAGVLWITDYPAPKHARQRAAARVDASAPMDATHATATVYRGDLEYGPASDETATVWAEGGTSVPGSDRSPYKERGRDSERGETEKNHGVVMVKAGRNRRGSAPAPWQGKKTTKRRPSGTGPLFDLDRAALTDPDRLDAIYRESVKRGYAVDTERDRLRVATLAQHAVRKASNPGGLFLANLRTGRDHAAQIDEDAALALLRQLDQQRTHDQQRQRSGAVLGSVLSGISGRLDADRHRSAPKLDPEEAWRMACDLDARHGGEVFRRRMLDEHGVRVGKGAPL